MYVASQQLHKSNDYRQAGGLLAVYKRYFINNIKLQIDYGW